MSVATSSAPQMPAGPGRVFSEPAKKPRAEKLTGSDESKKSKSGGTVTYTPSSELDTRVAGFKAKQAQKEKDYASSSKIPFGYDRDHKARSVVKESKTRKEAEAYAEDPESRRIQNDGTEYAPGSDGDSRGETSKVKESRTTRAARQAEERSSSPKKTRRERAIEKRERDEARRLSMLDDEDSEENEPGTEHTIGELQRRWDRIMFTEKQAEFHELQRRKTIKGSVGSGPKGTSALTTRGTTWTIDGPVIKSTKKTSWADDTELDYEIHQRLLEDKETDATKLTGRSDAKAGRMKESEAEAKARYDEEARAAADIEWYHSYKEGHKPRVPIGPTCLEDYPDITSLKAPTSKYIQRAKEAGKVYSKDWLSGQNVSAQTVSKLGLHALTYEDSYDQARYLSGLRRLIEGRHQIILPSDDLEELRPYLDGHTVIRKTPHELHMEADGSWMTNLKQAKGERVSIAPYTMENAVDHLGERASAPDFMISTVRRHKNDVKATKNNSTLGAPEYSTMIPANTWQRTIGPYSLIAAEDRALSDPTFDFDNWANTVVSMPNPTVVADNEAHRVALKRQLASEKERLVEKQHGCDPWTCVTRTHTSCRKRRTGLTTQDIVDQINKGDTTHADGYRTSKKGKVLLTWEANSVNATISREERTNSIVPTTIETETPPDDIEAEFQEIFDQLEAEEAAKERKKQMMEIIDQFRNTQMSGGSCQDTGSGLSAENQELLSQLGKFVDNELGTGVGNSSPAAGTLNTCASEMADNNPTTAPKTSITGY